MHDAVEQNVALLRILLKPIMRKLTDPSLLQQRLFLFKQLLATF